MATNEERVYIELSKIVSTQKVKNDFVKMVGDVLKMPTAACDETNVPESPLTFDKGDNRELDTPKMTKDMTAEKKNLIIVQLFKASNLAYPMSTHQPFFHQKTVLLVLF